MGTRMRMQVSINAHSQPHTTAATKAASAFWDSHEERLLVHHAGQVLNGLTTGCSKPDSELPEALRTRVEMRARSAGEVGLREAG
jgi:hypothetical protein